MCNPFYFKAKFVSTNSVKPLGCEIARAVCLVIYRLWFLNTTTYTICKQAVPCLHRDTRSEDCWITVEHLCAVLASSTYPNDCETHLLCNTTTICFTQAIFCTKHTKWQRHMSVKMHFKNSMGITKEMQKCKKKWKPAKFLQQFTLKVSRYTHHISLQN